MTTARISGAYQWGRRDCQPSTGSYSAWAVGGGADGANLACDNAYPDNVQTTMIYGPFSLADAKMAQMRFTLRYDQMLPNDDFCWLACIRRHGGGRSMPQRASRPGGRRWTSTWVTWTPRPGRERARQAAGVGGIPVHQRRDRAHLPRPLRR